MSNYISVQPSSFEINAIANEHIGDYNYPLYEHYNWCLDYLESDKPRVYIPRALLPEETTHTVQQTMIKACKKYLEDQINAK